MTNRNSPQPITIIPWHPPCLRHFMITQRMSLGLAWMAVVFLGCLFTEDASAQTYRLMDLGAPGEQASYTTGINSNGVVTGYSLMADGITYRGWKWSSGSGRVFLPDLGGGDTRAMGVNGSGQVVGVSKGVDGVSHGFVHSDATGFQDIGGASGTQGVIPQSINEKGHVAGYLTTVEGNRPFLWTGTGVPLAMGVLADSDLPAEALAYDLNDVDEVVGEASGMFGGSRGFMIAPGSVGPLSALDTLGGETATAYDVNNEGSIVGEAETGTGAQHAFLRDSIAVRDLGTLGGLNSTAFGLSEVGDVVGASDVPTGVSHAFVWSVAAGLEDLNSLVDPALGWTLNEAHAVNDEGWVGGNGTYMGGTRAFLIIPREGPDTSAPSVIARLSSDRVDAVSFASIGLVLSVWDDVGIEVSTLTAAALHVEGPGGYNAPVTLSSRTPNTNSISATASFLISPRGGSWEGSDNGEYVVWLEGGSFRDMAGNSVPRQRVAAFSIHIDVASTLQVAGPTTGHTGDDLTFTLSARGSYPSTPASVFQYRVEWEGQSGLSESISGGTSLTLHHQYPTPGARIVRFVVKDANGSEAMVTRPINVRSLATGGWVFGPSLNTVRSGFAATVFRSRMYLIGGYPFTADGDPLATVQSLGAVDADWRDEVSLDSALVLLGAGVDARGRFVAFGGAESDGDAGNIPQSAAFTYVPGAGRSAGLASLPQAVNRFAVATDSQARIYCVGGIANNVPSTAVYRYDGSKNAWATLAPLPEGRYASAATEDGHGHIVVIGGLLSASTPTQSVLSYDITSGQWRSLPDLPVASAEQAAALGGDGMIYVVGGFRGSDSVYVFDPVKAVWSAGPALNMPRRAPALLRADQDHLFAIGGDTDSVEILDTSVGVPARVLSDDITLTVDAGTALHLQPLGQGSPGPRWTLQLGPQGMAVQPETGAVDWVTQAGVYTAIVRAQNPSGWEDWLLNLSVTVTNGQPPVGLDKQPPATPGFAFATNITATSALLRWGASTDNVGVAGYRLYNYTRRCSGFKCIRKTTVARRLADNLTATVLSRTGLTSGQSYTFGIAAFDAAGNESPHARLTFLTLSPPRILPQSTFDQTFAIVNEPFHWQFGVSGNPMPTLSLVSGPPGLVFGWDAVHQVGIATWAPVQGPAGDVPLTLSALNSVTNLQQSFSMKVYPEGTDLYPPSFTPGVVIVPGGIGPDRVSVSWLPATDNRAVAGYRVTAVTSVRTRARRSCGRGCTRSGYRWISVSGFSSGTSASFTLMGLNPNTRYGVYVQAIDTAGFAGPASPVTGNYPYGYGIPFTTHPLYAAQLVVLSDGRQSFSWEEPEPPVVRVGDYYNYTVLCANSLSNATWTAIPGVVWPTTNLSFVLPPGTATNAFYKVDAQWVVH